MVGPRKLRYMVNGFRRMRQCERRIWRGCALLCQGIGLEMSHSDQLGSRSDEDRSYQQGGYARPELPLSQGSEVDQWRWKAIQLSERGTTLARGVDWHAPRLALKKSKGIEGKALKAIWQGAIRHGRGNQPASLAHVLWECSWWKQQCPEPQEFQQQRACHPDPSLWLRGLPGVLTRPSCYQIHVQETWVFQQQIITDPRLKFATDGSPDFLVEDQEIVVRGTATGPVPYEQTVFRAEAQALSYLVTKTKDWIDVTLD